MQEALLESPLFDKLDDKLIAKYRRLAINSKSKSKSKSKTKSKSKMSKSKHEETTEEIILRIKNTQYTHWNDDSKKAIDMLNYLLAKETCAKLLSERFHLYDGSLLSTKIVMHVYPYLENSEIVSDSFLSIECSPAENQVTFASKVCSELLKIPKYSFLPQVSEWADDPFVLLRYLEFRIGDSLLQIDFSLFASLLLMGQYTPNCPITCKVIVHFGPFSSGSSMMIPEVSPISEVCSLTITHIISSLHRLLSLAPQNYRVYNIPLNKLVMKLLQNDYCVLGSEFPSVLKSLLRSIPELFEYEIRFQCLFASFRF